MTKNTSGRTLFLSTDFETTGTTGPVINRKTDAVFYGRDGLAVLGERQHDIIQGHFRVIDPATMKCLGQTGAYIKHDIKQVTKNADSETIAFHKRNASPVKGVNFWDYYLGALKDGSLGEKDETALWKTSLVELNELELNVILLLKDTVLAEFGEELQHWEYGTKVEIVLLGKSIGFDQRFIAAQMPNLSRFLCYQPFDVSLFKVGSRLWEDTPRRLVPTESTHVADEDCLEAEKEAMVYKEIIERLPKEHRYLIDAAKAEPVEPTVCQNIVCSFFNKF